MDDVLSERGIQELLDEASRHDRAGRYADAERLAAEAIRVAVRVGAHLIELRARSQQADAHRMLGMMTQAREGYSQLITAAEEPEVGELANDLEVVRLVLMAYLCRVYCVRFLPEGHDDLLTMLDEGEAYLERRGPRGWRAGLCSARADVLCGLGRTDEAVRYATEALELKVSHPDAPGYTLNAHRWSLANALTDAGRRAEAGAYYQQVLDDRSARPADMASALVGQARCALKGRDASAGRAFAERAVTQSEPQGDEALSVALHVLIEACVAQDDLEAAWRAAERRLGLARGFGRLDQLYGAVEDALDVSLARADLPRARALLEELAPIAERIDASVGRDAHSYEVELFREQLAGLEQEAEASPES